MYRRKKRTLILLLIVILFISVGYALLSATLNIQGVSDITASRWDIHWDAATYTKSSGSVDILNPSRTANSSPILTDTDISFGTKLEKPGDYAQFTVNVVNDGTFDAELTAITISPALTPAQQKYLEYTVTYAGVEYHTSTSGLRVALPASTSNTAVVKIRVEYIQPSNAADLPSTDTTFSSTVSFDYAQAY